MKKTGLSLTKILNGRRVGIQPGKLPRGFRCLPHALLDCAQSFRSDQAPWDDSASGVYEPAKVNLAQTLTKADTDRVRVI